MEELPLQFASHDENILLIAVPVICLSRIATLVFSSVPSYQIRGPILKRLPKVEEGEIEKQSAQAFALSGCRCIILMGFKILQC